MMTIDPGQAKINNYVEAVDEPDTQRSKASSKDKAKKEEIETEEVKTDESPKNEHINAKDMDAVKMGNKN